MKVSIELFDLYEILKSHAEMLAAVTMLAELGDENAKKIFASLGDYHCEIGKLKCDSCRCGESEASE